jgi:hypothetical protein
MNFMDDNGEKVVHFAADIRTLGKLGELSAKIIAMAESGAWRRYRTAVGTDEWRECEFDYFLIACDVAFDDVDRAIRTHRLGGTTRNMMNPYAEPGQRRDLEDAARAWHAATPETLPDRAARLGWVVKDEQRVPLSKRQLSELRAGGVSMEDQARDRRSERLSAKQRRELNRRAKSALDGLTEDEGRYLLDAISRLLARDPGQPAIDRAQWMADIERIGTDAQALAKHWRVAVVTARWRIREVRRAA